MITNVPRVRLLVHGIETILISIFSTMQPGADSDKHSQLCLWSRDSLEWTELNTYSPLIDTIPGDFRLTSQQLEDMATETREHTKTTARAWRSNTRARQNALNQTIRDKKRY